MPLSNSIRLRGAGQILMVLALAASFAASSAQEPQRPLLVLFPFGLGNEVMATQGYKLEDELSTAVRAGFDENRSFQIVSFSRSHPSVRRGLAEGTLRSALLLEPFTGQSQGQYKALTLGKLFRSDYAFAGVVEQFDYSATNNTARLVVSIELFNLRESKLAGVVGLTAEGIGETEHEAAKNAAAKLAELAVPQAVSVLMTPKKDDGHQN